MTWLPKIGASAIALTALAAPSALPAQTRCDRACLTSAMTGFLDALVSRDPAKARLASAARYTEDGVELPVGEGLWATATGLGRYRHDFADTQTGNAAVFTIIDEGGHKSILSARVKVAGGRITEAETIVSRAGPGKALPTAATRPSRTATSRRPSRSCAGSMTRPPRKTRS